MSKIDYTNEYKALLEAFVSKDEKIVSEAARAMGLQYHKEPVMILIELNDKFTISGSSAEGATCVLRDEYAKAF